VEVSNRCFIIGDRVEGVMEERGGAEDDVERRKTTRVFPTIYEGRIKAGLLYVFQAPGVGGAIAVGGDEQGIFVGEGNGGDLGVRSLDVIRDECTRDV
jgi:hypothetical protein